MRLAKENKRFYNVPILGMLLYLRPLYLELGGRNISLRNFLRFALALETTPEKLMTLLMKQTKAEKKDFNLQKYLEKEKWVEGG